MIFFKTRARFLMLFAFTTWFTGCGGGGGTTTSFTVSSSAGANGSTSSSSATVTQDSTTSFTVTPDTGYVINTVTGCGGTLTGNTFTTGPITANCTVTANFSAPTLTAVSALFPTNGTNWNDYVSGSDYTLASDTACNTTTDTACLHGGQFRTVVATGLTDCTDLSASDTLGAFNWVCDISTGTARFVSTGLANNKTMSSLINFSTPGFLNNAVTLSANSVSVASTTSAAWWTNTFTVDNDGGPLNTEATIYLAMANPSAVYTLDANKISFVIQPGVSINGPGTSTNVVSSSNRDFIWFEGTIDASGDNIGILLNGTNFSTTRNVVVKNAATSGFTLTGGSKGNQLMNIKLSNNNNGFAMDGASTQYNLITNIISSNNGAHGLALVNMTNNTYSNITSNNNGQNGFNLAGDMTNNIFTNLTISNNDSNEGGLLINNNSTNNIFAAVTANMNRYGIRPQVGSHNNTFISIVAANNSLNGIISGDVNNHTFADIAMAHNGNAAISLFNTSNHRFTGLFETDDSCIVVAGGTDPGLVDVTCAQQGASDFGAPITGIDLTSTFVGKVLTDDVLNTDDTSGNVASFPVSPPTFDWSNFDNNFRGWGPDGSAFPDADHRRLWTTGAGRIWDWSVAAGDNGNAGNPALLNVLATPTGNDTLTHVWAGTPATADNTGCNAMVVNSLYNATSTVCETTYLRRAIEIQGDAIGNENALCESGETCLHLRNIGSYQGHGNLVSAGAFTAGTLTGITLMQFEMNGR